MSAAVACAGPTSSRGPFDVPGFSELGLVGDYYLDGDILVLTSFGYPGMVGEIRTLAEEEPC